MDKTATDNLQRLTDSLAEVLHSYSSVGPDEVVTPIDAFFIYRLLLGRNPDRASELADVTHSSQTFRQYLTTILESSEFGQSARFLPSNRLLLAEVEGFRFWFNSSDREMGSIMAFGSYEPRSVALLKRLVRPGMRCLDVGAQTGFFTCLLATLVGKDGKVYAFEPMPASYALLSKNILENSFDGRVCAFQRAASDAVGTISGSLTSGMYVVGEVPDSEPVRVEAVRVDEIVRESIDLVKIDVEGHEPAALRGMAALIARDRPIIISEANERWLRSCSNSSAAAYVDSLIALGYDVYDVSDVEHPVTGSDVRLAPHGVMDVVALPSGSRHDTHAAT